VTDGLLALDVATTTGFAYGLPGERPTFGHFRSGKPGADTGTVLAYFHDWLVEHIRDWRPMMVVFESPYVPRVTPPRIRTSTGHVIATLPPASPPIDIHVLRRLISMCGLVELVAHEHRIACREEASNIVCKHFTGRGSWGNRVNKKAATQKMCAVYGWRDVTEDEADALSLWVYAEAMLFPELSQRRGAGPLFVASPQDRGA
jgi:hypothetical protein